MKFLIVPNLDKGDTINCVRKLHDVFADTSHKLMYSNEHLPLLSVYGDIFSDSQQWLFENCDAVIAIGGDGTVIHTAKLAAEAGKPIIGINSGHLGFTAEIEPDEINLLTCLADGDYSTEQRMMLDVSILSADGTKKLHCNAINDAVITRGSLARIIALSVTVDNRPAISCRADGLIISTPTGSTAYALSAGGPVIAPQINCIPVTPICPHDLSSRTVIFSDSSELTVTTEPDRGSINSNANRGDIYLTVDGEMACPLSNDDRVIIKRSAISACFIKLKNIGFSEILRSKFNY